jgi:hypothetical protein
MLTKFMFCDKRTTLIRSKEWLMTDGPNKFWSGCHQEEGKEEDQDVDR